MLGLGYLVDRRYVSEALGLPPTPFWRVPDVFFSLERFAFANEVQKIASSYSLKNERLVSPWEVAEEAIWFALELRQWLSDGSVSKNPIVERDVQLLDRIPGDLLHMNPCMIDYALNVGLASTFSQWIAFLKDNGRLQVPTRPSSILDASLPPNEVDPKIGPKLEGKSEC